jgi:hypothetical protein
MAYQEANRMEFDLQRVRANVRNASTEDLLDRATVYRTNLEPEALPVILEELKARGVTADAIVRHERDRPHAFRDDAGVVRTCARCRRPAVTHEWGWHRMFGKLPLFPRRFYLCEDHCTNGDYDDPAVG